MAMRVLRKSDELLDVEQKRPNPRESWNSPKIPVAVVGSLYVSRRTLKRTQHAEEITGVWSLSFENTTGCNFAYLVVQRCWQKPARATNLRQGRLEMVSGRKMRSFIARSARYNLRDDDTRLVRVSVRGGNGLLLDSHCIDLSETGMRLNLPVEVPDADIGGEVDVEFYIPNSSTKIAGSGCIVRSENVAPSWASTVRHSVAVRFTKLTDQERRLLGTAFASAWIGGELE
jgi:hypothetical protein